jgi:hypothetical protein
MFKLSPLELRQSLTDARIYLHLYKLSITDLKDLLDDFESYGLLDVATMFKILNERLITLTRIMMET